MKKPNTLLRVALFGAGLCFAAPFARAGAAVVPKAPEVPNVPEVPEVPEVKVPEALKGLKPEDVGPLPEVPLRVVGFQDRPGDCPAVAARQGGCVEEVDFLDLADVWGDGADQDRARRAALHEISDLWARNLESMAYRWFRDKDLPQTTMQADGLLALPSAARTWEAAHPDPKRAVALPDRQAWLDSAAWTGQRGFYAPVRYATPSGAPTPAPVAVLSGRFARRLGYDGRPYDYDIMDGDRATSAPFFEQMYPFSSAWSGQDARWVPLAHFAFPRRLYEGLDGAGPMSKALDDRIEASLQPTLLRAGTWDEFERRAATEFSDFSLLLGVQIARYALAEHTANHMRVLASLTLMRSPPEALTERAGRTRDLVAAALGQTDSEAAANARIDRTGMSIEGGFQLRYQQLPQAVVEPWLTRLLRSDPPPNDWLERVFRPGLRDMFLGLVNQGVPPVESASPDAIRRWLSVALLPGKDQDSFALEAERLALSLVIETLSDPRRDEVETAIFLDHVNVAIGGNLDHRPDATLSPEELVAMAGEQWRGVIVTHGRVSRPVSQGLGAIDPTAICTTLDGRAAQSEQSIRAAKLDLLIVSKAGYQEASELLWAERDRLPLLSLDDPGANPATLERLTDLPPADGTERSLYRVRWEVWTGWHLLWTSEAVSPLQRRLVVRSAAICSDIVLAAPDLVPTLVRGALLDGNLRPTTPVSRREARRARKDAIEAPSQAGVADLQALGRAPLRSLAAPEQGLMVAVFDVGAPTRPPADPNGYPRRLVAWPRTDRARPTEHPSHPGFFPRTPYLSRQRLAGGRARVRSSAWAWYLRADATQAPTLVAPGLRPDPNVASDLPRPRWHNVPTMDFDLNGGLNFEPFRVSQVSCSSATEDQDVVEPCPYSPDTLWSYGFGANTEALTTFWLRADRRLAVESGLVLRLDVTPPGHAWVYRLIDDDRYTESSDPLANGPDYAWGLRPAAGVVVGLRAAPVPAGLWRLNGGAWPWGAERPDGSSRLNRTSYGVRATGLFGSSYSGAEITGVLELWAARSLRDARGAHAPFTPYHPAFWLGPYAEGLFAFHPDLNGQDRYLALTQSWAVQAGFRGQIRLKAPISKLPEPR